MKKFLYILLAIATAAGLSACSPDDDSKNGQQTEITDNPDPNPDPEPDPDPDPTPSPNPDPTPSSGSTLIVYYSFTNNVNTIVNDLRTQIEADAVRVEPAEKGLDYAADNYAIGSALIQAIRDNPGSAASYPAIDAVDMDFSQYGTVIVATPLWWSNMAAPMQTFLFNYGAQMAGKRIGLIVSSASSSISSVESDAKRLIPEGNFISTSLWIRSSQTSNCHSMTAQWLKDTGLSE